MADRKSDFALPTLDDLFSTQEERDDARLEKIRDIPLDLIDDFPDHPFHVRDDEDMVQLVESIKTNGVLTPAVLRQKEDGRYELVSGHRRKRACELAELTTLRSEIKDLTRDEAVVYMVESNFQRTTILPSEKAFAYKMRFEAMKRQGKRTDLTSSPVGTKLRTDEIIAQESGDSRNQIHRYIRLTNERLRKILQAVYVHSHCSHSVIHLCRRTDAECRQELFEKLLCRLFRRCSYRISLHNLLAVRFFAACCCERRRSCHDGMGVHWRTGIQYACACRHG